MARLALLVPTKSGRQAQDLENKLRRFVVGQDEAIQEIVRTYATEQIDAIESLSIDSFKFLVVPRIIACTLALPILTLFLDFFPVFSEVFFPNIQRRDFPFNSTSRDRSLPSNGQTSTRPRSRQPSSDSLLERSPPGLASLPMKAYRESGGRLPGAS
jgi:hypothetical protein